MCGAGGHLCPKETYIFKKCRFHQCVNDMPGQIPVFFCKKRKLKFCSGSDRGISVRLLKFHSFFKLCQQLIESDGDDAENGDAEHGPVKFEYLAGIDNQVAESGICREEFTDDDTDEGKSDADLHDADDDRKIPGKDYFGEHVFLGAAEGVDELDFFLFGA